MVSLEQDVDTGHEDMIHDAQMDYYGTHLATCSSDKNVKIFELRDGEMPHVATLKGHNAPVWQVAWAHPSFGSILASCSYDRKIILWKESDEKRNNWEKIFEYNSHESSVNSISWAPSEYGLILAAGSSDGSVSVICKSVDDVWEGNKIQNAHTIGCNAVSWGPINAQIAYANTADECETITYPSPVNSTMRFVTGGCDNLVKIWKFCKDGKWKEEEKLEAHTNWVRDVVWSPSVDLCQSVIASCSQDKTVIIWTKRKDTQWIYKVLNTFDDVIWHVSFSITGGILAVSGGDNKVSLWKAVDKQHWIHLNDVDENMHDVER